MMGVDADPAASAGLRAEPVAVSAIVNGEPVSARINAGTLLLDFLRGLGLHGTRRSCDVQMCGVCSVLVDGEPVSSCCYLAVDVDGHEVRTIEGLARDAAPEHGIYQRLEDAFVDHAAVQCGFCTPGFLVTLTVLIRDGQLHAGSTIEEVRAALRGNICRCTGYEPIMHAVTAVLGSLDAVPAATTYPAIASQGRTR